MASQNKQTSNPQSQTKRQKEWIYLTHYLAITGLNPVHIISGTDDGHEPDFTLVFYRNHGFYYIGVELTTLPKLRDNMADTGLISKRWYWQALNYLANKNADEQAGELDYVLNEDRFRIPMKTLYMPTDDFSRLNFSFVALLQITQQDVDEVMNKKAHKVDAYHQRRHLQELWLLVHTDKYQQTGVLLAPNYQLVHDSAFEQVHITRYPSHKLIDVKLRN